MLLDKLAFECFDENKFIAAPHVSICCTATTNAPTLHKFLGQSGAKAAGIWFNTSNFLIQEVGLGFRDT
jgi:hypothetical protein